MKLFIVTCLKEYQDQVRKIFRDAGIDAFSATDIIGHKNQSEPNLMDEWFAAGEEKFDSLMIFSFTEETRASQGLTLIKDYNEENSLRFPIRAFIIPVEQSLYSK